METYFLALKWFHDFWSSIDSADRRNKWRIDKETEQERDRESIPIN